MPSPIGDVLGLVRTLGDSYAIDGTTVTGSIDSDVVVTIELDAAAHTFRVVEAKHRAPAYEAGGIFNAAKRGGLLGGHLPQRRVVKEKLVDVLKRSGWRRVR